MQISRRTALKLAGAAALVPATAKAAPVQPSRELRVKVRGGEIYVAVFGDLTAGRAPLMMVNGGPGFAHYGFIPALPLTSDRALVLYDQLDTGKSERPGDPANWTVERFVSEVDAVRAALDLDRFHMLGHSWGGAIANEYAGRQPAGLVSLVLESPYVSTKSWEQSNMELLEQLPPDVRRDFLAGERSQVTDTPTYRRARDVYAKAFFQRGETPAVVTEYMKTFRMGLKNPYTTMIGKSEFIIAGTLRDYDGEANLPRINVPTLVMCGEFDQMSPKACRAVADRIRNAELAVVPGAGHLIQYDRPDEYVEVLRRWLRKNDGVGRA